MDHMETSESKWVNPDDILYGVNSLRVRGLYVSSKIGNREIRWNRVKQQYLLEVNAEIDWIKFSLYKYEKNTSIIQS